MAECIKDLVRSGKKTNPDTQYIIHDIHGEIWTYPEGVPGLEATMPIPIEYGEGDLKSILWSLHHSRHGEPTLLATIDWDIPLSMMLHTAPVDVLISRLYVHKEDGRLSEFTFDYNEVAMTHTKAKTVFGSSAMLNAFEIVAIPKLVTTISSYDRRMMYQMAVRTPLLLLAYWLTLVATIFLFLLSLTWWRRYPLFPRGRRAHVTTAKEDGVVPGVQGGRLLRRHQPVWVHAVGVHRHVREEPGGAAVDRVVLSGIAATAAVHPVLPRAVPGLSEVRRHNYATNSPWLPPAHLVGLGRYGTPRKADRGAEALEDFTKEVLNMLYVVTYSALFDCVRKPGGPPPPAYVDLFAAASTLDEALTDSTLE